MKPRFTQLGQGVEEIRRGNASQQS